MAIHRREIESSMERRLRPRDRRESQRYWAGGFPIQLSWTEEGADHDVVASLLNISVTGAAALVEDRLPEGARVRLTGDDVPEDLEATVVRVAKTRVFFRGPFLVRLRFVEDCPYDTFKAVINSATAGARAADEDYDRRD